MQTGPLENAVKASLKDLKLQTCDKAATLLAGIYARRIDEGDPVEKLGPLLLVALEALGMTPRARMALLKGDNDGPKQGSPLDELRARRAKRQAG